MELSSTQGSAAPREDPELEDRRFMQQLKRVPAEAYFLQKEVLFQIRAFRYDRFCPSTRARSEEYEERGVPIQVRDLPGVNHYSYPELLEITESFKKENFISNVAYTGKLFKGKIKRGSGDEDVLVKTWDFNYPPSSSQGCHPRRIHDEIRLLTNPLIKSHPNVVKLIGFHCNKGLAVVYVREDPRKCCKKYFLQVAIGIGSMLRVFHEQLETVDGGIINQNILVDENYCPKIFNFRIHSYDEGHPTYFPHICRSYGYSSEKFLTGPVWSMSYDVFAYGVLLLELITKQGCDYDPVGLLSGHKSCVVHESFQIVEPFASRISRMVVNCLRVNSPEQPAIGAVVDELQSLVKLKPMPLDKH